MTTQKQIEANRQNAQRSTGPREEEGKAIVAMNALKHGIFSKQILLDGESQKDFEDLEMEFLNQFHPQGLLERLFCERALVAAWRLSRTMKMESMLITDAAKYSSKGIIEVLVGYEGDKLNLLSRYEISLERILFRSLAELRLLQAPRQLKDGEKIGFVPQNLPEEIMAENVI